MWAKSDPWLFDASPVQIDVEQSSEVTTGLYLAAHGSKASNERKGIVL